MIAIHNGEISKNFQIFKPIETSKTNHKFKINHDNKELFLQIPRCSIFSILQPFENMYRITLKFDVSNTFHKQFIEKIINIESIIKKTEKHLWKTIGKNTRNKSWNSSIKYNNNKSSAFMKLTGDKSILSVFDHNKKSREVDYIIKNSEAICIIYLKHIWRKKNNIGLGWNLFQTKVFQPIQKIEECIIYDEHEDNPLLHYFNVDTSKARNEPVKVLSDKEKESHPVFGKYVKLKRLGANTNIINMKLMQDGHSKEAFENFMSGKSVLSNKTAQLAPVKLTANLFQNAKLKKIDKTIKRKPKFKQPDNQCIVTEESLAFAIKSLKKPNIFK